MDAELPEDFWYDLLMVVCSFFRLAPRFYRIEKDASHHFNFPLNLGHGPHEREESGSDQKRLKSTLKAA